MASAKTGYRPNVRAQDGYGFCACDDGGRAGFDRSMDQPWRPRNHRRRRRDGKNHARCSRTHFFSDGFGSDAETIRIAMATYFNTIAKISPFDILGLPDFVPRLSRLRVHSTLKFFEAEVDRVISARRRILAERPDRAPNDLLTRLLEACDTNRDDGISEAEVRSNILAFIAAGHETTANTLSWALFLLSQSQEWRERVEAEVDRVLAGAPSVAISGRLVETRAVIEEAIRLYPPIAAISRVALDHDDLSGEAVRPGSLVVTSPYVLHRHRLLWDRPDAFDPRRFLGGAQATIDRFAYLPFGAGPRKCIGSTFALQEATLVLAVIVKHFRFQLKAGHAVWPTLRLTLRPANGLPMILSKRSSNDTNHNWRPSGRAIHDAGAIGDNASARSRCPHDPKLRARDALAAMEECPFDDDDHREFGHARAPDIMIAYDNRRSFTDDYKRQAVDLVASSGRSIGSVAKERGLRDSVAAMFHLTFPVAKSTRLGRAIWCPAVRANALLRQPGLWTNFPSHAERS
jgi:cytochrome P450